VGTLPLILFCLTIGGFYVLRYYNLIGYPSSYTLTQYQGGILFRRGRPIRAVGPGRHRISSGIEKIFFLDKRPVQINVENRAVRLADSAIAAYGFSASAQVGDVRKALYGSANYTQIPAFVTLCVVRRMLNQCRSNQIAIGRAALEDEIISECRSRLTAAGFELISFRFTQLGIATSAPSVN
jgi:regulator of protease activity HflC (stomatin/prohibitin superfamily)